MIYLAAFWLFAFAIYWLTGFWVFHLIKRIFSLNGVTSQLAWKIGFISLLPLIGIVWSIWLIRSSLWPINRLSMSKCIGIYATFFVIFWFALIIPTIPLNYYGLSAFRVSGNSMAESFHSWEYVVLNKFSYKIDEPARGDIAIVRPNVDNGRTYYLQRVIGLPGDEIKIENGNILIKRPGEKDFSIFDEPYLSQANKGNTLPGKTSNDTLFKIPNWTYFVLGDNRMASADSRDCFMSCLKAGVTHYVARSNMVGKVIK